MNLCVSVRPPNKPFTPNIFFPNLPQESESGIQNSLYHISILSRAVSPLRLYFGELYTSRPAQPDLPPLCSTSCPTSPRKTAFEDVDILYNPQGLQHFIELDDRSLFHSFSPSSPSVPSHRATTALHTDPPDIPSKPTLAPPLQLTFGVEIGCYLLFRPDYYLTQNFMPFEDLLVYKPRSKPRRPPPHHSSPTRRQRPHQQPLEREQAQVARRSGYQRHSWPLQRTRRRLGIHSDRDQGANYEVSSPRARAGKDGA